jgi:hypothetical protein
LGVDHRRRDISVPEQLLDSTDIVPVFRKVRRKRVPERVAARLLGDPGRAHGLFDRAL